MGGAGQVFKRKGGGGDFKLHARLQRARGFGQERFKRRNARLSLRADEDTTEFQMGLAFDARLVPLPAAHADDGQHQHHNDADDDAAVFEHKAQQRRGFHGHFRLDFTHEAAGNLGSGRTKGVCHVLLLEILPLFRETARDTQGVSRLVSRQQYIGCFDRNVKRNVPVALAGKGAGPYT